MKKLFFAVIVTCIFVPPVWPQSGLYSHLQLVEFFILRGKLPAGCMSEDMQMTITYSDERAVYADAILKYERCIKNVALVNLEKSYLDAAQYLQEKQLSAAADPLKRAYLKLAMAFESSVPTVSEGRAGEMARKLRVKELTLDAASAQREVELELRKY